MSYWSIIALLVTSLLLLRGYISMSWSTLPDWLVPTSWKAGDQHSSQDSIKDQGKDEAPHTVPIEPLKSESTPKAKPVEDAQEVPAISLARPDQDTKSPDVQIKKEDSTPLSDSGSKWSSMPPPPRPTVGAANNITPNLMPPPSRTPVVQRAPPSSAAASLRVPSSGPLPNRGPPGNSQQRASGGLSPNGAVSTPNARGKVLLSPGHSPMDWAALTRTSNLAGVSTFQRVTPSQLRSMTGRKGKPAWSVWQGKVYNITPYLPFHPGGEAELMKGAGRDGTKLFMDNHPWVNWENMLESCLVGILVPEDYAHSSLEDMD